MDRFEKKEVIQAILIADNNIQNLRPISDTNSTALLPLVNVALLDYALEALNRCGIEEVFIYASFHLQNVREHIKRGVAALSTWSVNMKISVIGGEGCRCFGDAMRDLDAKALIRGNFILLGADTVLNADLRPILEEHKKTLKYDKGAAATLIFKEATSHIRTGNEVMIAMDIQNKRLHYHQRLRLHSKETHFQIPLEVFLNNSKIALMHNLIDPQIAIGSPSMLSLFSDNFDFETRDDFVRGILINEEILDSRIYVALLPRQQYARKVNNWQAYQIVSHDVINRWAYPLVPDMGICGLQQQYIFLKNNIYKSPRASVTKVALSENVVVQADSTVEATGSSVNNSIIGRNCKIGKNCKLSHAYLMDNVTVDDGCVLEYCVIGANCIIGQNCTLTDGTVLAENCKLTAGTKLAKKLVKSKHGGDDDDDEDDEVEKLNDHAYIIQDKNTGAPTICAPSDTEDEDLIANPADFGIAGIPNMSKLPIQHEDSDYTSSSDEDESHMDLTPVPDDQNIFLSEVMDSLARGYQEKSNPDFLVLEINSSRYAYNMSLKEVNFYVVKALFSMECIKAAAGKGSANILVAVNNVLKLLGPVLSNYIKTDDAMLDCLKALEDVCTENEAMREKISQVVHHLYDKDFITEEAILMWYEQLDETDEALKQNLAKLVAWLNQSSDEDEESESE